MQTTTQDPTRITLLGIVVWLLAVLFFQYEFFLRTIVNSFAAQITASLHLTDTSYTAIAAGYELTYGLMQIPVGYLIDRYGFKPIMVFAISLCAAATWLLANAHSAEMAIYGRLLTGIGSAFAFVCLLMVLRQWFPHRYFGTLAGVSSFIATLGPMLAGAPLANIMTATGASWRTAVTIMAIFGAVLAFLCLVLIRTRSTTTQAPPKDEHSVSFMSRLGMLIRNPQVWYIALFSGATYCAIAMMGVYWGEKYLNARGLNAAQAGVFLTIAWLGYAIGCPLFGFISDKLQNRRWVMAAGALIGFVSTLIMVMTSTTPAWLFNIIFFGIGLAASIQTLGFAIIAEHTNKYTRATALGLNNGMESVFNLLTPFWISFTVGLGVIHGKNHPHGSQDFVLGFSALPVFYLIAIILVIFFIKETRCKDLYP